MNSVILALGENPHLPFEVLKLLTDEKFYWVKNHTTPASVLEVLAQDKDWSTRGYAAEHHSTPVHVLEKLSQDSRYVRICVAENPNTPVHVLEKLSQDSHKHVRMCVARNPNTPPHVLEKMIKEDTWPALGEW